MNEITFYIFLGLSLFFGLAVLSYIDARTFRLPNLITLPLLGLGLLSSFLLPHLTIKVSVIGALIGYLGLLCIELAFKRITGKDGLGRGDAKLLAAGGAWCGALSLPYIILMASLCGLVFSQMPSVKKKAHNGINFIPFGPFLSLSIGTIWVMQVYLHLT